MLNERRRRKRQLRNIISVFYCSAELLLAVALFGGLGKWLDVHQVSGAVMPVMQDVQADEPEDDRLTVCIDAGHGGKDNGSNLGSRMEKDDNLKLAIAVAGYLEQQNVRVVMTRETDVFLSLQQRCQIANDEQAAYLVSLHRNDGNGKGVEIWVSSDAKDETLSLAGNILQGLKDVGIQKDRGVKQGTQKNDAGDYYVNQNSDMPSCIVELGFISDSYDNKLYDEQLEQYAAAIGNAILKTYQNTAGDSGAAE